MRRSGSSTTYRNEVLGRADYLVRAGMKPPFLLKKSNEDFKVQNIQDTEIYGKHMLSQMGNDELLSKRRYELLAFSLFLVAVMCLFGGIGLFFVDMVVVGPITFIFGCLLLSYLLLVDFEPSCKNHDIVVADITSLATMVNMNVDRLCATKYLEVLSRAQSRVIAKAAVIQQMDNHIERLRSSKDNPFTTAYLIAYLAGEKENIKASMEPDFRILMVFDMGEWTMRRAFEEAKKFRPYI